MSLTKLTDPRPLHADPPRPRLDRLFAWYAALAHRRTGTILLVLGILAVLTAWPISRLELHTDMTELLPEGHPAVMALRRVGPRQKSSTNLVLLIGSPDAQANERLLEALRPALQALVPAIFTEIQWRPDTEIADYYSRWRWMYADKEELLSAERLLERLEAKRRAPLFVDLEGDPEAELRALRTRLYQKLPERNPAPRFEGKNPGGSPLHYLGVMLWRRGDGLATLGDHQTLEAIKAVVARLPLAAFHPEMRVEYTGHIAMALEEQAAVRSDLGRASAVCMSLVLLSIFLYFRRWAVVVAVGAPAVLGVLVSLALAQLVLKYLNANTAFLISIILGNGINSPIILLSRYGEERRRGLAAVDAVAAAMSATFLATLTAMAAASIAYGSLMVTSLRGLSQFGWLGGVGMLIVWCLAFVMLPPIVIGGERLRPGLMTPKASVWRLPFAWLGRLNARIPRALLMLTLGISAASLVPAYLYAQDPLEYDWSKLRNQNPDGDRRWGIMYDLGMGNVGAGHIARDGVILVDEPGQADLVAQALWKKDQALGKKSVLLAVRTLNSLLPADQEAKLEILARIRRRIDQNLDLMDESERREAKEWRPPDSLHKLVRSDLPHRLRENFTEVDGTLGRFIGIDADASRYGEPYGEQDGRSLKRLARSLEVTVLGKTWVAAASSTVFAGMLETIENDGPTVTICAAVGVVLLIFLTFGPRGGLPVLAALLFGLVWLGGVLGAIKLKLNFLNFVALPITLGVGADYAANLWARLRTDGLSNLSQVIAETGGAVALCSVTTIIGYSSLLLASNRALQTFGLMADIGEITCLLAALVALPAMVHVMQGRGRPRGRA